MTKGKGLQSRILRGFAVLASGTLFTRATGMLREMVLAFYLGSSAMMDAYVVAFTLPNLFRRILGEKVLEAAVLPTYKQLRNSNKEPDAANLMKTSLLLIVSIGCLVTGVGMVFTPLLVNLFAPGFDPATHTLAVAMSRIMFPFLVLISVAAMFGVILQTREKFGLYALAPALFNIAIIGFLWIGMDRFGPVIAAWGVLAGGFLEGLVMYPVVRKTFSFSRSKIRLKDPSVKTVNSLALPVLLETILDKTIVLVDRRLASIVLEGGIAALGYAFRLLQLPYGILVLAIARTFYQHLVNAAENTRDFVRMTATALRFVLCLMLPCSAMLIIFSELMVRIVYQRGAFDEQSVKLTTMAFQCYAPGIVGMTLLAILTRAFNALRDTRTPVKVSIAMMTINIILNYALVSTSLAHAGLALASSIAYTFAGLSLLYLIKRKLLQNDDDCSVNFKLLAPFIKILVATGLASFAGIWSIRSIPKSPDLWSNLVWLGVGSVSFGLVYVVALYMLRLPIKTLLKVD